MNETHHPGSKHVDADAPSKPQRRGFLMTGPALAAALTLPASELQAQTADRWAATWGAARPPRRRRRRR